MEATCTWDVKAELRRMAAELGHLAEMSRVQADLVNLDLVSKTGTTDPNLQCCVVPGQKQSDKGNRNSESCRDTGLEA